jgi:hypothetical protein
VSATFACLSLLVIRVPFTCDIIYASNFGFKQHAVQHALRTRKWGGKLQTHHETINPKWIAGEVRNFCLRLQGSRDAPTSVQ